MGETRIIRASPVVMFQKTCIWKFFGKKVKNSCFSSEIYQKTCISKNFGPNSKTCIVKVRAAWGRVSRGLTVFTFKSHWLSGRLWYERTIKLEVFGFSSSQQLLPSIAEQLTLESPFSKFSVGDRCGWSKRRRRRRGVNTTKRGRPRRLPAEINLVGNCFPCKLPLFRWWTSGCWRPSAVNVT